MTPTRLRRALAGAGLALCCGQAGAAGLPGPIDHVLQLRSSGQYQSNPARLPDSSDERRGAAVLVNSIGAALRIPLLSDDTRLDIDGNLADVRYSNNRQLDHQPVDLDAALHWRAGRLFAGRFDYGYEDQLNTYLSRTWPERDTVSRRRLSGEAGLRVTESLTLPVLSLFGNDTRYERAVNAELYDRDESGWQVSARYAGTERSYAQVGLRETQVEYPERGPALVPLIDDGYRDREYFVQAQWHYSPKTLLIGRVGYLQRDYDHLSERDTSLLTFDANAIWDYSPKTRFDLQMWRRPYAYDDNPAVIYSTQTGASLGARWQATAKVAFGMAFERILQKNTAITGDAGDDLHIARYGARLEWQPDDRLRWVLDFYRDRQRGASSFDSYSQNFVRLGVEYTYGSKGSADVAELLRPGECEWRRPEFSLC